MKEYLKPDWLVFDTQNRIEGASDNFTISREGWIVRRSDMMEIANPFSLDRQKSVQWSATKSKTINFKKDYLSGQIRVRYAMFDRPTNGLSNVIIDSFAPRCLYQSKLEPIRARGVMNPTKTAVAISPWFAQIFGVKQMEPEQLCRILGYDKKSLKRLLDSVKKKEYHMTFIGYGGTNVNTIHWLSEISNFTNSVNLFKEVYVYEPEDVEISNLLRFPLDPTASSVEFRNNSDIPYKTNLIGGQLQRLSKENPQIRNSFYIPTELFNSAHKRSEAKLDEHGKIHHLTTIKSPKHIIYGAPGIATRQELSKYGNFISATHANTSCRLDLNPEQDTVLQVESYGVIQLSGFFMNQLRMAIGLLETLASEQDFSEKDKTLMTYEFDGTSKLSADRQYNFQLSKDNSVATEEEANRTV